MANIYFSLTREFNAEGPIAVIASGQAVVYYRIAIMSKDGDWILKESREACERVLTVLASKRAHYRPGAPLDTRWLAGGWSSHLEFADEQTRRIRCDFFTRPPRVPRDAREKLFVGKEPNETDRLLVVDLKSLILMKQTQRAKDYPTVGELARKLTPELELEFTTDPDRIMELAPKLGAKSKRPSVAAALAGKSREDVVATLAREVDRMQQMDRERLLRYQNASREYVAAFRPAGLGELPLRDAHARLCELAEAHLPKSVEGDESATAE